MAAPPFLALLALAAAADPPPRLTTPPLPFGIVCGPMPVRDLGAVPLTGETTLAQVAAAWGEPTRYGPDGEMFLVGLTCDARLWLSFEPGGQRRLTRAILFTGSFVPMTRVLLDNLDITRRRRCDQVPSGDGRTGRQLARAWGPPDNEVGSGMVRWVYQMADGGLAQAFPTGDGRFMVGCTPHGELSGLPAPRRAPSRA
jgi:hypothetical protein